MTRPSDFTAEFQRGCDEEIARFRAEQKRGFVSHRGTVPDCLFDIPAFREVWYAGAWLKSHLLALGCCEASIRDICFNHGRRCALDGDPWPVTHQVLAEIADHD